MTTPPETNAEPQNTEPEYDGPISQVEDDGRFGENRTEDPYDVGRRANYVYRTVAGLLVVALLVGAWWIGRDNREAHKNAKQTVTSTHRVYFSTAHTSAMAALIDPQAAAATSLMAQWWSSHDPSKHYTKASDTEFVAWLAKQIPGPAGDRTAELAQVKTTVKEQDGGDSEYMPAARFLSKNGAAQIWNQEAANQGAFLDTETATEHAKWTADALELASRVTARVSKQDQLSAPYVVDHSLAPTMKVTKNGACPCSYPGPHASAAAAARTLLGGLQPASDGSYAWMQQQVAYSTLFLGHAYPSDVVGGTLVGDAVGQYMLVTRAHHTPPAAAQ